MDDRASEHGLPQRGLLRSTVDVEDQFGNLETTLTGSVTVALDSNPGNADTGRDHHVQASGGIATFSGLTINVIGNDYTLVASSGNLTSPASTPIDVLPNPAASLELTTPPPTSVQVYQSFGLTITALDQDGNPDPDFTGRVTVAIAGTPGSNTLGGTSTVNAVDGSRELSRTDPVRGRKRRSFKCRVRT